MATKQVTFKIIKLQGFKSYSYPVSFQFSNTGLHLIKGANGGGKTSLFSALVWALYKVNLNDTANTKIPTFKHKRTKDYKGTRVQVLMGIGKYKYLIARHIDFKGKTAGIEGADSLLIFRKEKMDKTPFCPADILNEEGGITAGQVYLDKILGIDAKTFLSSVIFGQRMNRLMDSKDADKRDLFERLFDVAFVDDLKTKAVAKTADTTSILQQLEIDLKGVLYEKQVKEEQLESAQFLLDDFAINRKKALAIIRKDHEAAKVDLEYIDKQIELAAKLLKTSGKADNLAVLAEAQSQASEAYYNVKSELALVQRDIDENIRKAAIVAQRLKDNKASAKNITTTCPTCGSPIQAGKLSAAKEAIRRDAEEIAADIERCNNLGDALSVREDTLLDMQNKKLAAYTKAMDTYTAAKQLRSNTATDDTNAAVLAERRSNKLQTIKQMVSAFNNEKAKQPPTVNVYEITKKIEDLDEKIPALEKAIRIKSNTIVRLNWWLKAFSANGIKSYIFSAQLNNLNSCVAAYTSYFNISIVFGIDLTKASKPFYCACKLDGKNEVDYNTLSGGEKQRVDLAIAFGLQDSAETVSSFNISVMDEPEGNLDSETLETLDMLIRIRSERKACYIISHNNQMDLSGAIIYNISGGKTSTSVIE